MIIEHTHGSDECRIELAVAMGKIWETWEACAAEGHPCQPQCTFEREGATDGGTMTLASWSAEIRRRLSPGLCDALDANMAQCLSMVGGSVGPGSPCENWETVGGCIVNSLETVCDGVSRRGRIWPPIWGFPWYRRGRK
ncbi:unnamed protein product [Allacma fusca]|uniref:Uncharacterized protein n=1 Tax=Allacma fusca TaxID=39272 RepID=A0A8J2PJQ3_9HEXA|nr:unnamed protein product [Allacma fusca]